jgi:hypothetical protein
MGALPIAVTNKATAVAEAESCLYVSFTYNTEHRIHVMNDWMSLQIQN